MLPLAVLLPSPDTFSDFSPAVLAVFEPDDAIGESLSSLLTLLGVFGGSDATLFLSSFRKEVTALAGELLPLPFLLIVARRSFKEVFEPSLTDPPPLPAFCDRHWSLILSTSPIAGPLCCYHSVECKLSHALTLHRPPLQGTLQSPMFTSASSMPQRRRFRFENRQPGLLRREGKEGISTSPRRVRVRVIALAGAMPGSLRPIRRGPRPLKQEYGQKVLERLGLDNPKEAEQAEASTMRISPRSARPTTDMRDSSMSPRCVSLMFWPGGSCVCLFTPSISLSLFPVPSTESHAALLLPVENGKEWQEGEKRGG